MGFQKLKINMLKGGGCYQRCDWVSWQGNE